MFSALALVLFSCGNEDPNQSNDPCEGGQPLTVLESQLCVYDTVRNPIIETGFNCPAALEFQFEFGPDVVVCSPQPTLPAEIGSELANLFPNFEIGSPWIVGAEPLQDPRSRVTPPTILMKGRSAGTCEATTTSSFPSHTYEFDQTGRVIRYDETEYSYDAFGWLIEMRAPDVTTEFERDEFARVTRITETSDVVRITEYQRDSDGRRIGRTETVDGTVEVDLDFTWSADGLSVDGQYYGIDCDGTTTYDQSGRVVQVDMPDCAAFADPLYRVQYVGEQYAGIVQVDRTTGDEVVETEAEFDDEGRVVRTRRGIVSMDPDASELLVQYDGDYITELNLGRISDGSGAVNWQLVGECQLSSVDLLFDYNFTGVILGP